MGLTSALNNALFGVTFNQRQLDVTSQNIANKDTVGYTKKQVEANVFYDGNGGVSGLLAAEITRVVNNEIQSSYLDSLADTGYGAKIAQYTSDLDAIFGTISDGTSVQALASRFTTSLSSLINDPSSRTAQTTVVADAEALAYEIRTSYEQIQDLRQRTDRELAAQVEDINALLSSLADVETDIRESNLADSSTAQLLDQRDRYLEDLSKYLDVNIKINVDDSLKITTRNGELLLSDGQASKLTFTETPILKPGASGQPIMVRTPGGTEYDLVESSASGTIVGLAELRDEVFIEAQDQLDQIAAEMTLALNARTVEGTEVTVGSEEGETLDLSSLKPGEKVEVSYTDASGQAQTVTLIAVDDPALLPLEDDATPRTDDTVFGLDISSGTAATIVGYAVAALSGTGLAASNDGSDNLQVLGDSGASIELDGLTLKGSVTGSSNEGLGLNIFTDNRDGEVNFTDYLENGGQRTGYAIAIDVNSALKSESSLLVFHTTTPSQNSENDPARAEFMLDALTKSTEVYNADTGIGTKSSPYEGSVMNFINQVVAYQGNQAEDAQTYSASKSALTENFAIRYEESYAVDLDEEMAQLVNLQNAYAANARVMQAVNELFDRLLGAF